MLVMMSSQDQPKLLQPKRKSMTEIHDSMESTCDSSLGSIKAMVASTATATPITVTPAMDRPIRQLPLVQSIQRSSSLGSPNSQTLPLHPTKCVAGVHVASIFAEPSAHLQQVLRNKASIGSFQEQCTQRQSFTANDAMKQPNQASTKRQDDLLHRACCIQDVTTEQIQQILQADPLAASRCIKLSRSTVMSPMIDTGFFEACKPTSPITISEDYSYPLNLAIYHKTSSEVLALLICAAPQVLLMPDGLRLETSLHILLRYSPHETKTVLEMILRQPGLASMMDQQGNFPLHIACHFGADNDAIQYLYIVYPAAWHAKNQLGQSPNDLMVVYKNGKECPAA